MKELEQSLSLSGRRGIGVLQESAICDPCEQIEALRPGLEAAIEGRRGMLSKVARGGLLERGDEIVVSEMPAAAGGPREG